MFIAYSRAMEAGLRARLPHRGSDIRFLPYGVTLPAALRVAGPGPLRLVFAGRLEHGQKGVLDLPRIDRQLAGRGVPVAWTIIGAGPHERELRAQWGPGRPVTWLGALSHQATLAQLPQCDVFVLPTRAEGLPVALIEAMGAGLVPVVSDIPSGVPEVVEHEVSGLLPPVGDVAAFAASIEALATDRERLERMSAAARASARRRGSAVERARDYYALFDTLAARPRAPRAATTVPYGSRLDRAWIPNAVVRGVRALRGRG